jgi:hypothetical protein
MAHLASGRLPAAHEGQSVASESQEVAPMETYVSKRPAVLPAAVAPVSAARILLAADAAPRPRVHQVLAQIELGQAPVSAGYEGTNGFSVKDVPAIAKRMDVRGVPPRGRPV